MFYTYTLVCRDKSLYIGHTDDLDVRLAQHQLGQCDSYTAKRRPVHQLWCDTFPTRDQAFAADQRLVTPEEARVSAKRLVASPAFVAAKGASASSH
ncbi:MAG: GIY-YIG nuclease family protein [Chloroflexota bacterium]